MNFHTAELLGTLQAQTEAMLNKGVQTWQMIPSTQFNAQPTPGSWSAAQCLHHLNSYGEYYLPLLKRAIQKAKSKGDRAKTFTPGWLGNYFTKLMLPSPSGIPAKKMKAPKNHVPPTELASHEVVAAFIDQQERLLKLLEIAVGLNLNHREIPISISPLIRLKTGDTFRFLIAHNLRHTAQADRALQATHKVLQPL
jgi:uncharacterized damage-inducible protein DinB